MKGKEREEERVKENFLSVSSVLKYLKRWDWAEFGLGWTRQKLGVRKLVSVFRWVAETQVPKPSPSTSYLTHLHEAGIGAELGFKLTLQ